MPLPHAAIIIMRQEIIEKYAVMFHFIIELRTTFPGRLVDQRRKSTGMYWKKCPEVLFRRQ